MRWYNASNPKNITNQVLLTIEVEQFKTDNCNKKKIIKIVAIDKL